MFAAHFATGLAIKSQVPEAPIRPLLAAVFFPDFVWIVLAGMGIEPAAPGRFFDGWSHSLAMVLLYALLAAFAFRGYGKAVATAFFVAVFSHFLLDLPIHPAPLQLYPHSAVRFDLHIATVGSWTYWIVELCVALAMLAIYARESWKFDLSRARVVQSCIGVLAVHLINLPQ